MKKSRLISVILVLCLLAALLPGCKKAPANEAPGTEGTPTPTALASPTPTPDNGLCPLTGLPLDSPDQQNLRPFAVMIDNELNARPQSGLFKADIVYEMPAEGNITRYMAVFHHMDAEKIGPVRSARPYFIDKAMEYGAVYVHCGGSPQALKDLVSLKINALNDLKGDPCFWRARDRKMPHNLYSSTKLIREVMGKKKWDGRQAPALFKFNDNFQTMNGKRITVVQINYDKYYKVSYEYDTNEKVFIRNINGSRLKDKETEQPIKTTNLIIEIVDSRVLDDKGRLEVSTVGSGRGYFLTGGELIELQWSKKGRRDKTIYKDLKGNEIQLNKGNTWIQVVPDYVRIDIKE